MKNSQGLINIMLKHGGNKSMVATFKTNVFEEKEAELQVELWANITIINITI